MRSAARPDPGRAALFVRVKAFGYRAPGQKVLDYFEAGSRLVWFVDPRTRTVTVHRSLREVAILREDDRLSGAPVLPDLDIPAGDLFR